MNGKSQGNILNWETSTDIQLSAKGKFKVDILFMATIV